ncbi:hypothetical protein E4U41_000986 [Claviceps citrina]|nr:hypothetical protein E4U41_000986 [Claviceps citrina]
MPPTLVHSAATVGAAQSICISTNCGLCQSPIVVTEEVTTCKLFSLALLLYYSAPAQGDSRPWLTLTTILPPDISGTWTAHRATKFCEDTDDCPHGGMTSSCHERCYILHVVQYPERLLEVNSLLHEPSDAAISRREAWVAAQNQTWAADQLAPGVGRIAPDLPLEILRQVASHLPPQWAVSVTCKAAETYDVSFDRAVWCEHGDFRGEEYILALSNTESQRCSKLLFRPEPNQALGRVYVQENHTGLTKIVVVAKGDAVPEFEYDDNSWWRIFDLGAKGQPTLTARFDGIKLRSLRFRGEKSTAWRLPPRDGYRLEYVRPGTSPQADEMELLVCNDPRTTAYSVLLIQHLRKIHAHVDDEQFSVVYETRQRDLFRGTRAQDIITLSEERDWLYMPMGRGELIREIYTGNTQSGDEDAIGLVTNRGRIFVAGAQPEDSERDWTLVDRPPPGPSRIFYGIVDRAIQVLAFENQHQPTSLASFQNLIAASADTMIPYPGCYRKSVDLTGLTFVIPSTKLCPKRGRFITGLLFGFADGHQECVGLARRDSMNEIIYIEPGEVFVLTFKWWGRCLPFVADIGVRDADVERDPGSEIYLTPGGVLHWASKTNFWTWVEYQGLMTPEPEGMSSDDSDGTSSWETMETDTEQAE